MRNCNTVLEQCVNKIQTPARRVRRMPCEEITINKTKLEHQLCGMWSLLLRYYNQLRCVEENQMAAGWSTGTLMFGNIAKLNILMEYEAAHQGVSRAILKKYRGATLPFVPLQYQTSSCVAPPSFSTSDRPIPELLKRKCISFKSIYRNANVMYPERPVGALTQFQLYSQMNLLSDRAGELSILNNDLRDFLAALFLRFCELLVCSFSFSAAELDMGNEYRSSVLDHGIKVDPVRQRRMVINGQGGPMVNMEDEQSASRQDKKRRENGWQINQRYINEMMGMFVGFKRIAFVFRVEWEHEEPMPIDATDKYGARLLSLLLHKRRRTKITAVRERDLSESRCDRAPAYMTEKQNDKIDFILSDTHATDACMRRFNQFTDKYREMIDSERDKTLEQQLRDRIAKDCRSVRLPPGCVEKAVYLAHVENETDEERVEQLTVPYISVSYMVNQWTEVPLSYFDRSHHSLGIRMCMYAHVFNKLALSDDKNANWYDRDYVDERSMRNGRYRSRVRGTNPMPFVMVMMGDVFVVHGSRIFTCRDPQHALMIWCLICSVIHDSKYSIGHDVRHMQYLDTTMDRVFTLMPLSSLFDQNMIESAVNDALL